MEWYIGNEWQLEVKGLNKKVLALDFTKLEKPHQVSKVAVIITEVNGLNGRDSKFLNDPSLLNKEQILEMGSALTPVDCHLELLVREMIVGESALCSIHTKAGEITFVLKLEKILESKEIHKLSVSEMYALALGYKENGVAMFKDYPTFAHDYFARAAKCLISYKPFDELTAKDDGVAGNDMEALLLQIQTNLAACLLTQQRYEDVLYHTQSVETMAEPNEKSIYRRAMAYFHTQEFEKAQQTIEKVHDYAEKKDFIKLHQRIMENWKSCNEQYKQRMQRMFN